MWLNEGFATYGGVAVAEDHDGEHRRRDLQLPLPGRLLRRPGPRRGRLGFHPQAHQRRAPLRQPVYERGAMVLHKIRQTVGDDTFHDIVQGWAAAHRHGKRTPPDFTAYVEKSAPDADFGPIWKDWLYGEGKPATP